MFACNIINMMTHTAPLLSVHRKNQHSWGGKGRARVWDCTIEDDGAVSDFTTCSHLLDMYMINRPIRYLIFLLDSLKASKKNVIFILESFEILKSSARVNQKTTNLLNAYSRYCKMDNTFFVNHSPMNNRATMKIDMPLRTILLLSMQMMTTMVCTILACCCLPSILTCQRVHQAKKPLLNQSPPQKWILQELKLKLTLNEESVST